MKDLHAPENKKKILIVDDDSFLLDMYVTRFGQAGFEVTAAVSAEDVLKKLHDGLVPDVALLDIVMPATDGFELLEQVNKEGLIKETVKIYLTNLGQDQDIEKGTALGAKGYIIKANNTPTEVVEKVIDLVTT